MGRMHTKPTILRSQQERREEKDCGEKVSGKNKNTQQLDGFSA